MSAYGKDAKAGKGNPLLPGAICGAVSMMITMLLMLGVSRLMAAGRLSDTTDTLMIMLCVFLGLLIGVLLLRPGRGGGTLYFAAAAFASYVVILLIMEMSVGAARLFSGNLLRLCICAGAGSILGAVRYSGGFRSNRRRANRR